MVVYVIRSIPVSRVLPRQGPADSERQEEDNKVYEHTKEGEDHDTEVTDAAKGSHPTLFYFHTPDFFNQLISSLLFTSF